MKEAIRLDVWRVCLFVTLIILCFFVILTTLCFFITRRMKHEGSKAGGATGAIWLDVWLQQLDPAPHTKS